MKGLAGLGVMAFLEEVGFEVSKLQVKPSASHTADQGVEIGWLSVFSLPPLAQV